MSKSLERAALLYKKRVGYAEGSLTFEEILHQLTRVKQELKGKKKWKKKNAENVY